MLRIILLLIPEAGGRSKEKSIMDMDRQLKWLLLKIVPLVLVCSLGCDPAWGIRRTAYLQNLPLRSCIMTALNSVPKVQNVQYNQIPSEKPWSLYKGTEKIPTRDQYICSAGSIFSELLLTPSHKNSPATLELSYHQFGLKPASGRIEEVRQLMDDIYDNLSRTCPGLPSALELTEEKL